jgi:predicted regulator of Ras-like GTPase activity (Roadblock/LC7/MglB family)
VPFRRLLTALVGRVSGARGAVFCDAEGESVALVIRDSLLSDYEMKVFGAQLAAVWLTVQTGARERGAGALLELQAGCAGGSLLCRALPDGYYVVLLVGRGVALAPAAFELRRAAAELAQEI